MKQTLKIILATAAAIFATYLAISFAFDSFMPTGWHWFMRLVFAVVAIALVINCIAMLKFLKRFGKDLEKAMNKYKDEAARRY